MAASAMAFEVAGGMDSKWIVAVSERTCGVLFTLFTFVETASAYKYTKDVPRRTVVINKTDFPPLSLAACS
jgi:hypothetical protein